MLLGLLTVALAATWAGVRARTGGGPIDPRLPAVRWLPVVVAGLVGQAALDRLQPLGEVLVAGEVVSLAALLAAGIVNAHLPGVVALTAGVVANGAAIVANAGMPVSGDAVRALGASPATVPTAGHHHLLDATSRLTGLADTLALGWFGVVVSPGDVLLVAGAVVLLAASLSGMPDVEPAWVRHPRAWLPDHGRPARSPHVDADLDADVDADLGPDRVPAHRPDPPSDVRGKRSEDMPDDPISATASTSVGGPG